MSYQDLLIHIPSSLNWPKHLPQAAQAARRFGARVTGIQVVEAFPPLSVPEAPGMAAALQQQIEQEYQRASGVGDEFRAQMAALGVDGARWLAVEGDISRALAHAGAAYDVIVLGVDREDFRAGADTVAQTVIEAAMPCLVFPESASAAPFRLGTVVLAWNGSLEAMRAIHDALPMLRDADDVVVLAGATRDYPMTLPHPPVVDLHEYLAHHRIGAREVKLDAGEGQVGAALVDAATRLGASLLVMGAYGRSRLREWIFGGATRHLLRNSPVPLLLRH
jgi:nucleotide-binding universal stress UspA family protein